METRAYLKGTRLSPQKAGLVANAIRGKSVQDAMDFLNFNKQKGSANLDRSWRSKSYCFTFVDDIYIYIIYIYIYIYSFIFHLWAPKGFSSSGLTWQALDARVSMSVLSGRRQWR